MVTLAQVARRAGVAQSTVSQVLRGNAVAARISEATQRRVLEAARRLNYRPNAFAQAVREGRFGCVGLILSTVGWRSTLPAEMLAGILDALAARNTHLSVARLENDLLESEDFMPKILSTTMTDGLLIDITQDAPPRMNQLIAKHQIPNIWLNCRRERDCVHPDDYGGAALLAQELLARGHRRIAYVNFSHDPHDPTMHYSVTDRFTGAADTLAREGLAIMDWRHRQPRSSWIQIASERLASPDRPTAVILYGPAEIGAFQIAAVHRGLDVPRDLSLATFGHTSPLHAGIEIAHARDNRYELGRLAVEMLLRRIADGKSQPVLTTDYRFEPGATIAPAP